MSKKIVIIGASGHGKVIADIAKKNGYKEIVFLDDNENVHECGVYPVVGRSHEAKTINADVIVGIPEGKVVTLIHPNAVVADDVMIGTGTVIMAGAVINSGVRIGRGCIINTCSSADHDCDMGDYVHIAVGSHLCGTVSVGDETWIGAGATVSNNISICSECMIGAGAVVTRDITEKGTYVGVPAKRSK